MTPSVRVAASLLACDFGSLHAEIRRAESAGADWLHLDVMDGHFVNNISFGPAFVGASAKAATVPLDVHLMIERPDVYLERFTPHAHNVTVHVEAAHDVQETLARIRAAGCRAGLAINPPTPFEQVEPHLDAIDLLLIMTVNPGFGGQSFIEETMEKVGRARSERTRRGLNYDIEVDGGINAETARVAVEHGAGILVAGTYVFAADDMTQAVRRLR